MEAAFFQATRATLRSAVPSDAVIAVVANGLLQRGADASFPFQQDSSFYYVTGIDLPDIILVLTPKREYLIVPGRSASRQAFDGAVEDDQLTKISGIIDVFDEQRGWQQLGKDLKRAGQLATCLPADSYIEQYGLYANPSRRRFVHRCQTLASNLVVQDIRPILARQRMIKQPAELEQLRRAIDITSQTLADVTKTINDFASEYELEAAISQGFRRRGARGHAFEPIVASGKNACTLHNVANNDKLHKNQLIVMDVGAEVSHYAADITRTVAYGQASDRQQAVFAAVLAVQVAAKKLLKPGVLLKDYELEVEQLIGEQLRQLGLITGADRADIRRYYPHATSHFLGLDVHDVGDYQQPLQANTVITVEPGIYIPEEAIGVRLEDDVLITANGLETLSAALPSVLQ